jgi:hypothetical protein
MAVSPLVRRRKEEGKKEKPTGDVLWGLREISKRWQAYFSAGRHARVDYSRAGGWAQLKLIALCPHDVRIVAFL